MNNLGNYPGLHIFRVKRWMKGVSTISILPLYSLPKFPLAEACRVQDFRFLDQTGPDEMSLEGFGLRSLLPHFLLES